MARYHIKTFGCKVNQVESDDLHAVLMKKGMQAVSAAVEADIVIVNTCTVTGEADRKVRKELRRSARLPNVHAVIVIGCSATLKKDELEALDEKITVLPNRESIPNHLADYAKNLPLIADLDDDLPSALSTRIRVPVKVQDGCEDFCSYCIVPFARGNCTSVNADEVLDKIKSLVAVGTKEVILTGINLGNYTSDGAHSLAVLIQRIQEETDLYRLRLSSIEPKHVSDELLVFLKPPPDGSRNILCEHLHIPLQSGSDYVLGDMNRSYSVEEFREVAQRIRAANPNTAITTDIIVGYPSEGDDDFTQTLELVKELRFAKIHVFRYSPREGTAAARLKPLNSNLVRKRAQILQDQADRDAEAYFESRQGEELELIVEILDEAAGTVTGTSREYLRLSIPAAEHKPGDLVRIT